MFRYSSSGNGGPGHLAGELFRQATGAELVHVPYRGQAAAIISVASGEVQLSIPSIASVLPQIRGGKLRAVAVTSEKRAAVADDIPTLAEEGYAGIESTSWTGLFAPAGLPATIVQTLHKSVAAVLRNPDVVAKMTAAGVTPGGEDPAAFGAFVRSDREKWRKVISTARIHID